MWSFRIQYHMRTVKHAYFVTLTYAHGQASRSENGFLTLNKKHFQNYVKRIRKSLNQTKETPFNEQIKYIVTGEYGTQRKRPHYHAIIFNVPYDVISAHWEHGIIDIREISASRIAYVFKYCQKARIGRKQQHSRDDRVPEYVNFSQGLGKQWLTPKNIQFHVDNIDNPTLIFGKSRIAIPRYYKHRIFTDEQRQQIAENMANYTKDSESIILSHDEAYKLLEYKNEKIRLMHKKAKKEQNE